MTVAVLVIVGIVLAVGLLGPPLLSLRINRLVDELERLEAEARERA